MADLKTIRRIILRSVLFVVFLEIYLRIGGVVSLSVQNYQNQPVKQGNIYRIMCIGESTTFVGGKDSYPSQLERILNSRQTGWVFEVINRGLPGNTSAEIAAHLKEDLEVYKPDMVIAMVGINDTSSTLQYTAKDSQWKFFVGDVRVLRVAKFLGAHIAGELQSIQQKWLPRKTSLSGSLAKEKLEREIRRHPKNSGAYMELGQYLWDQGDYPQAIGLFKKAIKANPKKDFGYQQLAQYYILQGNIQEAEKVLLSSLKKNEKRAWARTSLSRFYNSQKRSKEAEDILLEGIQKDPNSLDLYMEASALYRERGDFEKSRGILQEALRGNPNHAGLLKELGFGYAQQNDFTKAQEMLEKSAQAGDPGVFLDLSDWYMKHGHAQEAEASLIKALSLYPDDVRLMRGLATIDRQTGKSVLAEEYLRKAEELGEKKMLNSTIRNYRTIVQMVRAKGLVMISMSYAMRKSAPLKKILNDFDGVLFVDNESSFRQAIKQRKYEDYFSDAFAGDFGHGTSLGNRLLAQNAADVVVSALKLP
jgi:tetratricopeptide (TPR) repeat protein